MYRFALVAPILLAACSAQPTAPVAGDAYVRLAAVPGRPAAAYFVLHGGERDATLVQVSAPSVARAEMHASRMTGNGMTTMDSIAAVPVPARTPVSFAPGGRHVMLFGVPAAVVAGKMLPLTLRFADGSAVRAEARVIGAGEAVPG